MAKNGYKKSFYGMRLVGYDEPFIGLCWEFYEFDKIVLRFYHINQYDKYVYDELERINLNSVCSSVNSQDAFMKLKRIANCKKTSYNVFMSDEVYLAICEECELKSLFF